MTAPATVLAALSAQRDPVVEVVVGAPDKPTKERAGRVAIALRSTDERALRSAALRLAARLIDLGAEADVSSDAPNELRPTALGTRAQLVDAAAGRPARATLWRLVVVASGTPGWHWSRSDAPWQRPGKAPARSLIDAALADVGLVDAQGITTHAGATS